MSFLQPALLFALPLMALPILIHLINQNRHQTVPWAATMFLLQAKRMARGMARLRYLLLMLFRMLAIGGLILAVSRPMAGGWLGMTTSGAPDMTVVVLDRSVSMEEQAPQSGTSKRSAALRKLKNLIRSTESQTRLILFDSALQQPLEVTSVDELEGLTEAGPTATTADMPALMRQVCEYIETSQSGRTDVWVCSDLRRNDWQPAAGNWDAVRTELAAREGVRLFLLTYPEAVPDNMAVRVENAHRRESVDGAELVMDLHLTRSGDVDTPQTVDLTIVIDGASSRLSLELTGNTLTRRGHVIPLDEGSHQGWGRVELPSDSNPADNICRFVYAEPAARKTVIVSDDESTAQILRIAAATGADQNLAHEAHILPAASADAIPWENTSLIIWHAAIPDGLTARQLQDFVDSGRSVMFFPPESPGQNSLFGVSWTDWQTSDSQTGFSFKPWRTDSDLLANTLSGTPLPVGTIKCYRVCPPNIDTAMDLWQLESGVPVLARATTDRGGAWVCSTLPTADASSLVNNGVTLYVMIQRALAAGAAAMGNARQATAGQLPPESASQWTPLDELSRETLLSQRTITAGLYQSPNRLVAINRSLHEDDTAVIDDAALERIFAGVNFTRINDTIDGDTELTSEVWRTFLVLMILALMAEALLCVPEAPVRHEAELAADAI